MPKLNVYVPDDLKAEMDAVEGQEPNWSAVAQEAFRLECARLANRKRSGGKMDAAIERLRASKQRLTNQDKLDGAASGRQWALEDAEYDELERLRKATDGEGGLFGPPDYNGEYAWQAYKTITDDEDPSAADCRDFWESSTGKSEPSDDYVEAFVEAATEVFEEIGDKL